MIKKGVPHNSISLLYLLKHWIIFCFLLFIVAKPVIIIISVIVESKYEFYDNLVSENMEEIKEDNIDDEKIHQSFYFKTRTFTALSLSYFGGSNRFLSFEPDIDLPPPEL